MMFGRKSIYLLLIVFCVGCWGGPSRIEPPRIDPDDAALAAMELYDANNDGVLNGAELEKCPAVLAEIKQYDANGDGKVAAEEFEQRIKQLQGSKVGLTRLNCSVSLNGRALNDATVEFEPEPYLGSNIKRAKGVTNKRGVAQLAIAAEELPEDQRDLKAVHYGTYKVRINHPSIQLPAKYNTETTLGYESRPGDPYASFALKTP